MMQKLLFSPGSEDHNILGPEKSKVTKYDNYKVESINESRYVYIILMLTFISQIYLSVMT